MFNEIRFYVSLFLRRLHYFLVVAIAISSVGITVAYTLPPVYEAEARLLLESPQIPGNLAASTVQTGTAEQLQVIRQRLLTRASLLEMSREFGVHDNQPNLNPDEIVADMRKRIDISLPRSRRGSADFLTVSFEADNGPISAAVTNELVTRILQENISLRTAASGQTLEFFKQEVARLDSELAEQGAKILQFKLEHQDALPDSLDFRRSRQASLQERVLQLDRELSSIRDRRSRLVALYESTGQVASTGLPRSPEEQRLDRLRNELSSALVILSEQNPKVRNLQAQVAAQEAKVAAERAAQVSDTGEELSAFEMQISDLDGQAEFIEDQKEIVQKELVELQASIDATPANGVTLGTLQRDYENLRVQYNRASSDLATARTGDQIEAQSRGARITVIEQATPPRQPTSPDRRKIAAASVLAGIGAGLGLVVVLEFLKTAVRRPSELTNRLGITPFATIPYIRTRRQKLFRRSVIGSALAVVAIGIPVTLFMLHTYYLPMDMLIEKVLAKTGLEDVVEQLRQALG